VSAFFAKLEEFAERKQAAVIIAHHLKRGPGPKSVHDILNCVRGSQVFLDRPRVTFGMRRVGRVTEFAVLRHNVGAGLAMDTKRLRRDEAAFRHVLVKEPARAEAKAADAPAEPAADVPAVSDPVERVRAALARLRDEGTPTMGADSLFSLGLPELEGLSRTAIRKAMRHLT
jgi:hypothetical protein